VVIVVVVVVVTSVVVLWTTRRGVLWWRVLVVGITHALSVPRLRKEREKKGFSWPGLKLL